MLSILTALFCLWTWYIWMNGSSKLDLESTSLGINLCLYNKVFQLGMWTCGQQFWNAQVQVQGLFNLIVDILIKPTMVVSLKVDPSTNQITSALSNQFCSGAL